MAESRKDRKHRIMCNDNALLQAWAHLNEDCGGNNGIGSGIKRNNRLWQSWEMDVNMIHLISA